MLPGKGIYWILGSVLFVGSFLIFAALTASPESYSESGYEAAKEKSTITPDKTQAAVRAMADFMVKDDNVIGLRMWARSLGISAPDFASAATLRENVRRNTNDFEIYRDSKELTRLMETLSNENAMLLEVLNESAN